MTREETARLQGAFASATEVLGTGSECPAAEVLWAAAREELHGAADTEVILHVGACGACAAAWRLARAMDEGPATAEESTIRPIARRRMPWSRAIPIALAASLVLAAGVLTLMLRTGGESPEPSLRTQRADWLRPAAGMEHLDRAAPVLRWTAGPDGTIYDVRVTSEDLELLGRGWRLSKPAYRLGLASLEKVPAGGSIHWQVTAHLPDGRKVDSPTYTTSLR
jgi:hypothetical protein